MKPVFGYLRVSGRGQLDGDGETRQRAAIEKYCERKGFKVIRWFFDGAVSGEVDAADRDEFAKMLLFCGDATTRTIIVERSDRLGRTLVVCEIACEEARLSGLTILGADADTDLTNSDDPTRVLIRQMLGALAEWNKNVMVKRMRAARDRIRHTTGRCEGRLGFGRRNDPEDDFTLSLITTMKLADYSFRKIAQELDRRRRPVPEGRCWHKSTVHKIYHRVIGDERVYMKGGSKLLDGLSV